MQRIIRLEMTIEVDGNWPGDDEACEAAMNHVPSGAIELDGDDVLLINSVTAEVVHPAGSADQAA